MFPLLLRSAYTKSSTFQLLMLMRKQNNKTLGNWLLLGSYCLGTNQALVSGWWVTVLWIICSEYSFIIITTIPSFSVLLNHLYFCPWVLPFFFSPNSFSNPSMGCEWMAAWCLAAWWVKPQHLLSKPQVKGWLNETTALSCSPWQASSL